MPDKEQNLQLILLEIKRLKQLKTIRALENTMSELYNIEKELRGKLKKVEVFEEKALNEIVNQFNILEEIDINIDLLRNNDIESPIETLINVKSGLQLPFKNITKRFIDL